MYHCSINSSHRAPASADLPVFRLPASCGRAKGACERGERGADFVAKVQLGSAPNVGAALFDLRA